MVGLSGFLHTSQGLTRGAQEDDDHMRREINNDITAERASKQASNPFEVGGGLDRQATGCRLRPVGEHWQVEHPGQDQARQAERCHSVNTTT